MGYKILLVEDEPGLREIIADYFSAQADGCTLDTAADGRQALEKRSGKKPVKRREQPGKGSVKRRKSSVKPGENPYMLIPGNFWAGFAGRTALRLSIPFACTPDLRNGTAPGH